MNVQSNVTNDSFSKKKLIHLFYKNLWKIWNCSIQQATIHRIYSIIFQEKFLNNQHIFCHRNMESKFETSTWKV